MPTGIQHTVVFSISMVGNTCESSGLLKISANLMNLFCEGSQCISSQGILLLVALFNVDILGSPAASSHLLFGDLNLKCLLNSLLLRDKNERLV